jgi:hypothetical protein
MLPVNTTNAGVSHDPRHYHHARDPAKAAVRTSADNARSPSHLPALLPGPRTGRNSGSAQSARGRARLQRKAKRLPTGGSAALQLKAISKSMIKRALGRVLSCWSDRPGIAGAFPKTLAMLLNNPHACGPMAPRPVRGRGYSPGCRYARDRARRRCRAMCASCSRLLRCSRARS